MMPQMVGTAFHRRTRPLVGRDDPSAPRHNTVASIATTTTPVLEYVIASITQSAMPISRPAQRHLPRHPQQNGNAAQIAAAAWLGFANPNPCRTRSPTTKSTTHLPSAALDGHYQILSYQNRLRPSLPAHLQTSLLHPRAIAPNVSKSHPLHSATSQYVWTQGFACCIRKQTN